MLSNINNQMSNPIVAELKNLMAVDTTAPKRIFYKKKPSKAFLKWNQSALERGITFKHIDMIKNPNLVYDKQKKELVDKSNIFDKRYKKDTKVIKKKQKKLFIKNDKANTLIQDDNKVLTRRTQKKYKKTIVALIDNIINSVSNSGERQEITVDLSKINFKDLMNILAQKQTQVEYNNKTYNLAVKVEGTDKWIALSQSNILKLKNPEEITGDDFTYRVGSDNEFIFNMLDNPFLIMQFTKPFGEEVINGGFFKYYHTTKFNLTRYGIYNNSPNKTIIDKNGCSINIPNTRYNNNCLYIALQNGGLEKSKLAQLKSFVKSSRVPLNKMEDISKKLDIHIIINKPRTNGDVEVIHKNKNAKDTYKIGLIDNHYFIIDNEAQITSYCLKNYKLLDKQNLQILNYKNEEVNLLKDQIKLYDDRLNQVDKWYKKPWVGVVGGVVGTLITIHVIDYSLPR